MADTGVNVQVLDLIRFNRESVTSPEATWESGSGKAFQYVAQATAMAIQDATDNLRNIGTISTTAIGVAMAQMMNSGDLQTWGPVIRTAQALATNSAVDFQKIGESAATILKSYPRGPAPAGDKGGAHDSSAKG